MSEDSYRAVKQAEFLGDKLAGQAIKQLLGLDE
jgi:hypothetical protein